MNDTPRVTGSRYAWFTAAVYQWSYWIVHCCRYKVLVEVPVQKTLFRVLPATLQAGREIGVCAVLFTQGVNELQSLADTCVTCTGMYLPLPRFLPNYQSTHMYQLLTHACIPSQYT